MASHTSTISKTLKARINNNEQLYGIFLLSFSPTLAEIAGHAGYDFVIVDMEHGHGDISQALYCLYALAATQTPAIIRIPESSPTWVKKALDIGPQGIMFPMINDAESARKIVSYCRYPPAGVRGAAHPVVRASKYGIDEDYLKRCEDELLIMCQVESLEAVESAREIAAVDGVDSIMIGPLDLSACMGYLHEPGNKNVMEMVNKAEKDVLELKESNNVCLAGFAMPPHDEAVDLKKRKYNMVCGTVDVGLFRNAVIEDVRRFKMG